MVSTEKIHTKQGGGYGVSGCVESFQSAWRRDRLHRKDVSGAEQPLRSRLGTSLLQTGYFPKTGD